MIANSIFIYITNWFYIYFFFLISYFKNFLFQNIFSCHRYYMYFETYF